MYKLLRFNNIFNNKKSRKNRNERAHSAHRIPNTPENYIYTYVVLASVESDEASNYISNHWNRAINRIFAASGILIFAIAACFHFINQRSSKRHSPFAMHFVFARVRRAGAAIFLLRLIRHRENFNFSTHKMYAFHDSGDCLKRTFAIHPDLRRMTCKWLNKLANEILYHRFIFKKKTNWTFFSDKLTGIHICDGINFWRWWHRSHRIVLNGQDGCIFSVAKHEIRFLKFYICSIRQSQSGSIACEAIIIHKFGKCSAKLPRRTITVKWT